MPLNLVERVKGFLLNPIETFQKARPDALGYAFKYFIILLVIYAILSTIVAWAVGQAIQDIFPGFPGMGELSLPLVFVMTVVGGIIGVFIGGAWLHLWVYVFGARRGINETIKSVMYGSTPTYVIGWIPIVSIIGAIWSFVLVILGVRELQEISTGKAIAAVIIAIIIPLIIIIVLAAALFAIFSSTVSSYIPTY